MGFEVRRATRSDLPAVLAVQHEAFGRVAEWFDIDPDVLPPLQETLTDLEALMSSGTRFYVAVGPGAAVVGSVRGAETPQGVEIGRLVVDGRFLRQGAATALMESLEADFVDAQRFVLFTGREAEVPLALYAKLGYVIDREQSDGPVHLVWLSKQRPLRS